MKAILSEHEKQRNKNINAIKRSIQNLKSLGYVIEQDKNVETMFSSLVDNVYVRDYTGFDHSGKLILQKHLFTIE